jgi:hypothetical protein
VEYYFVAEEVGTTVLCVGVSSTDRLW